MNQTIIDGLTDIKDQFDINDVYRINTYGKIIKALKYYPKDVKTMSDVLYVLRKNGFLYTDQEHFYRKHHTWKSSVLKNIDELLCLQNYEITHKTHNESTFIQEFVLSMFLLRFLICFLYEFSIEIIWNWI